MSATILLTYFLPGEASGLTFLSIPRNASTTFLPYFLTRSTTSLDPSAWPGKKVSKELSSSLPEVPIEANGTHAEPSRSTLPAAYAERYRDSVGSGSPSRGERDRPTAARAARRRNSEALPARREPRDRSWLRRLRTAEVPRRSAQADSGVRPERSARVPLSSLLASDSCLPAPQVVVGIGMRAHYGRSCRSLQTL